MLDHSFRLFFFDVHNLVVDVVAKHVGCVSSFSFRFSFFHWKPILRILHLEKRRRRNIKREDLFITVKQKANTEAVCFWRHFFI